MHNSTLMHLTSFLGKDKALTDKLLTAMLESFKDVTKNLSKANDSGSENNSSNLDARTTK